MAWVGRGNPALVVVALLLCAGTAAGAPYLQFGVDAARTGVTGDPGPEHLDLAFNLTLPGGPAFLSVPLMVDGGVFVLVDAPGAHGVHRVDLATAGVTRIVTYEATASSMASDGTHLFVAGPDGIEALPLDGGAPVWTWAYPEPPAPGMRTRCAPLGVDGADVVAACTQSLERPSLPGPPAPVGLGTIPETFRDLGPVSFVAALDLAYGEERWTWMWTRDPGCTGVTCFEDAENHPLLTTLALSADQVIVGGTMFTSAPPEQSTGTEYTERVVVAAVERSSGAFAWDADLGWPFLGGELFEPMSSSNTPAPAIAVRGGLVHVLTWDLIAFSGDGSMVWRERVSPVAFERAGLPDGGSTYHGSGLAVQGNRVFASGGGEIVAFDVAAGQPERSWRRPINDDLDQMYGLIVAGGQVIGSTWGGNVFALDASTGDLRYFEDHSDAQRGMRVAAGEGVLVTINATGSMSVLGASPASPAAVAGLATAYPAPGEVFTLDLSSSRPGVFGTPTAYQVDWGDGTIDSWREQPTFEHVYETPGDVTLRAFVRNDAGQVASTPVTVHVGGSRPNFVETAFARNNQDLTFGILGLALALGGGLFAVTRTRTRRHRVQRELDAIEHAFVETRDRPRDCEAALAERRARVRGLGLDGKLDQAEVLLLERRIDELARELRLGTLEHQFHFLPYGFVMSLREMLEDGSISVWEREHLVRAIEADRGMTGEQKGLVKALVEEWAARDEGGAG